MPIAGRRRRTGRFAAGRAPLVTARKCSYHALQVTFDPSRGRGKRSTSLTLTIGLREVMAPLLSSVR